MATFSVYAYAIKIDPKQGEYGYLSLNNTLTKNPVDIFMFKDARSATSYKKKNHIPKSSVVRVRAVYEKINEFYVCVYGAYLYHLSSKVYKTPRQAAIEMGVPAVLHNNIEAYVDGEEVKMSHRMRIQDEHLLLLVKSGSKGY